MPIRYLKAGDYVLALRKRKYVCQKILNVTEHLAHQITLQETNIPPPPPRHFSKRIFPFPTVGYVSSLEIYGKAKKLMQDLLSVMYLHLI